MAQHWIDSQIDDALLATAASAGFLYARRRVRRVSRRLARSALVLGTGAALAGIGAVGIAGGALARRRRRVGGSSDWDQSSGPGDG
jgi:hypothetical protein